MLSAEGMPSIFNMVKQQMKAISPEELNKVLQQVRDCAVNEMVVASKYIPSIIHS